MSEKKQLEEVDEALHTIAQWLKIDVGLLREALKEIKNKTTSTKSKSNDEIFEKMLNEFIQNELNDSSDTSEAVGQHDGDNQTQQTETGEDSELTQHRYDILQNAAGEILIITNSHECEPDNPRIVYDGTDSALLYRSRESACFLNGIAPDARAALMKVEQVLVVEVKDDDVVREYHVPMRKVRSLQVLY